jgi:hypothetical protein
LKQELFIMGAGSFLQKVSAGALDFIAPEGSSLDKTAQTAYNSATYKPKASTAPATVSSYPGAMYYDAASGQTLEFDGANWNAINSGLNEGVVESRSTTTPSGASTSSAGSAEDVAYYNDLINRLSGKYGEIDTAYTQGVAGAGDAYNNEVSKANASRGRQLEDLDLQGQSSARGKDQAIGKVDTYARTLADSVRRRLGMASGSDSSAYQFAAPGAVARDASGKRTGVLEDFGANAMALDLTKRRAQEDYNGLFSDLEAQKRAKLSGLESGVQEQKQALDAELARVAGEKAKAAGGSYATARAAAAPYETQYNQRSQAISALFDKYRTPYTAKPVEVKTPSLRDYIVDKTKVQATGNAQQDQYAPYLKPLQEDEEQNIYA